MNGKFLTKLLDENYRNQILAKNSKYVNDQKLQLKQYATYVVDKHAKDRKNEFKDSREFFYGYDPIDVIAYCAADGTVNKLCFEFKTVNHFLHENNRLAAVDVVKCILAEIARERKSKLLSFDIDKIDADAKMIEETYNKQQQVSNSLNDKDSNNEQ